MLWLPYRRSRRLCFRFTFSRPERIVPGGVMNTRLFDLSLRRHAQNSIQLRIYTKIKGWRQVMYANGFFYCRMQNGVRNYENLEKGLREMYRVLKPE